MCGINGLFSFKGQIDVVQNAVAMNTAIAHRGMDDEGFVFFTDKQKAKTAFTNQTDEKVRNSSFPNAPHTYVNEVESNELISALGHRRLSVIDLSAAGHQPFTNADKRFWMVYNGELYNHKLLRKRLEQEFGVLFFSNSDTEVVFYSYLCWGEKCLNFFDGMWAFAIFDSVENQIFCARDPSGVKPFYYSINKNGFAFSSEMKAFRFSGLIENKQNDVAVLRFLMTGDTEFGAQTMLDNVNRLEPGNFLKLNFKNKELQTIEYAVKDFQVQSNGNEKKSILDIQNTVVEALESRLMADVEVGSCLSGGIDSSALAGISAMHCKRKLKCFTAIYSEHSAIDESQFAKEVIREHQLKWHTVEPKPHDFVNEVMDLVYFQDGPIISLSTYAQNKVMELVNKSGIKVVINGQGADELFAGYPQYFALHAIDLIRKMQFSNFIKSSKNFHVDANVLMYLAKSVFKDWNYNLVVKSKSNDLFLSEYAIEIESQMHFDSPPMQLSKRLEHDFFHGPLQNLLRAEDRNSMRHHVESRVPFADSRKLIQLAFETPASLKFKNGTNKFLLREALKPFLPKSIYERKDKKGFVSPHSTWVANAQHELKEITCSTDDHLIDIKKFTLNFNKTYGNAQKAENFRDFRLIAYLLWKKSRQFQE